MKRLLAQIGITCFSVLAVAFYLPEKVIWILLPLSAVASFAVLLIKRTRRTIEIPVIALTALIGFALHLGFTYLSVIPVQERYSGSRHIEATLTDEVYRSYSKYYYRLRVDAVDGAEADTKLLLKTARPIDIEPFDTLSFDAEVSATESRYYLSKGYYLTVNTYDSDFTVTEADSRPLYDHVIRLRQSLREAFDEYLPDDAASLCKAVLIGDKYALGTDVKDSFRYAGASYFVVVSGMHFSIICLLFYGVLKKLKVNRFVCVGLTLAVILLYMMVTGFQPSVVRAGVMMTVLILSRLIRRVGYAHNSLGLAGIVAVIVFSPYGVADISQILSFAATFAIITWSDSIYRRISFKEPDKKLKRGYNAFARLMSASLAANITVFPISVFAFGGFSTVTLLASMLLYLPIWLILVLSLLYCLFFYLGPLRYLSLMFSWGLYCACKLVLWIVAGLASLPFAYVRIRHGFFYVWTGITAAMGAVVLALRKRVRLLPYAALLSAILLIGGTLTTFFVDRSTVSLEVYQCGEGLTVNFNYRGSSYLLAFDAKSNDAYRIAKDVSARYEGAELAVCSKRHDFVNYSRLTDQEFAISHYLLYDEDVQADDSGEIISYQENEDLILGDGTTLFIEESSGKLLSYLRFDDVTVLIIPSGYPLKDISDAFRTADIIVMSRPREEYRALSCDTLIVSNTEKNAAAAATLMKDRCREILYTYEDDVTVPLR